MGDEGEGASVARDAPDALETLASLVDNSLVDPLTGPGGERRYGMLETVREYALGRLEQAGELERARRRHAGFFLRLVERAEPELTRGQEAAWLDRLEAEHANLRAALRWATDRHEAGLGLRVGGALAFFWFTRGYYAEGRAWLEALLALPEARPRDATRAKALFAAGLLARWQRDVPAARRHFEESLAIGREVRDARRIAWALYGLGDLPGTEWSRDAGALHGLLDEGAALFRELGDRPGLGRTLFTLGQKAVTLGDYARARGPLEESLAVAGQAEDHHGVAHALQWLGHLAYAAGDHPAAGRLYAQSLEASEALGERFSIAMAQTNLGRVAHARGDLGAAQALHRRSLAALWRLAPGESAWLARALDGLAGVAAAQDQPAHALRLAGAAAAVRERIGYTAWPLDAADTVRWLRPARTALGEATASAAWAAGRASPTDEAVAFALAPDARAQERAGEDPETSA